MTPEKETELFATLASISNMLVRVITTQESHSRQIEDTRTQVADVQRQVADAQRQIIELHVQHGAALAEMKGQQTIMLQWLQSMDQRFGALMVPMIPPKKAS